MLSKKTKLGGGTYGCVYEANTDQGKQAVKRLIISKSHQGTIVSVRELDILELVKSHPYHIQLKDVYYGSPFAEGQLSPIREPDSESDKLFFGMEKGDMDAQRWIYKCNPLYEEKQLFMLQCLLAVEFLHSRGVYHRDIKPANIIIFLDSNGKFQSAKMSDFGLANYNCPQQMSCRNVITAWYRPPEVCLHKQYGLNVDVWSLGCIFFQLFSKGHNVLHAESSDEKILSTLLTMFPFSQEDLVLINQMYIRDSQRIKSYQLLVKDDYIKTRLDYSKTPYNTCLPDSDHDTFIELLNNMLCTNPKERWSATECINSCFFNKYRELIDTIRCMYDISSDGIWITRPPSKLVYRSCKHREIGMKWFNMIYSARDKNPICKWYSHRCLFHAIEMFDRYLCAVKLEEDPKESEVLLWVNTCLFISSKYFRILVDDCGLELFSIGIDPSDNQIFKSAVQVFEELLLKHVLCGKTYVQTLYEECPDILSEEAIAFLLQIIIREDFPSGTPLLKIWKDIEQEIRSLNSTKPTTLKTLFPTVRYV